VLIDEGRPDDGVFPRRHAIGRFVKHRPRCVEHYRHHDKRGDGDDGATSPADGLPARSFCHYR
jgi:hypothetical protein